MLVKMNSTLKVRITVGNTTVEIEAPKEALEEAVKNVLAALKTAGVYIQPEEVAAPERAREQKAATCRRIVEEMLSEGWFKQARSLSEVTAELSRRGFNYDRTAVAHVLLDMVREGLLKREGEARRYAYMQAAQRGVAQESASHSSVLD